MRDVIDIQAAGRDVGGYQDVYLAGSERSQRLLPGTLAQVTMHRTGGEPALDEVVGNLLRGPLGPGEDQGQAAAVGLQDACQHLRLVHGMRPVSELGNVLGGRDMRVGLGTDLHRLVQELPCQRDDRTRHGGREQHRLTAGRQLRHQLLDIRQEAQVEHLICLVEHQAADLAEVEVPLLRQIQQPPRGANHYVRARFQCLDLRLVGPATVDGDDLRAKQLAGGTEIAGYLHG